MPELKLENSIVDDRYFVARMLGRGSYAEVFVAHDQRHNDEPVIIKALNVTLQGTPDADLERTLIENFQNEAVALDKVRHPNIIRRLGHGTAADLEGYAFHYLLLEYMPGGDLLSLCSRQPLALDAALLYFQQICEALAYAHSRQVIHRDLKPQNLLLSADKKVIKIADFGVAKMAQDTSDEITRVGTNIYAPPEHHPDAPDNHHERLTPSADIYSLAKSVYTAMTGRAPRQFSRQPITELPPSLIAQDWGASLLAVLNRATQDRAADRYRTVQEFWEGLARLQLGEAAEANDEATVVRRRLSGTSTIERAAAQPSFRAITTGVHEASRAQKARIIVNIPLPEKPDLAAQGGNSAATASAPPEASPHSRYATVREYAAQAHVQEPAEIKSPEADALRKRKMKESAATRPSFFTLMQTVITSDWLRRAFMILMIAAIIGLVASTYYYFADRRALLTSDGGGSITGKDGVISGALNINLRSDPGGAVLAVLPANSRVHLLEERGGWVRVKVLSWAGGPPLNAPDSGWIGKQFVNTD